MNKNDYPDRLKPERAIYAKVKDHDKVTVSGPAQSTWGILAIKRPPIQSIYRSKTRNRGNSKLLGSITVIVFNVPSHIFTIPLAGHHSIHQI
jgi:hypothetical protein